MALHRTPVAAILLAAAAACGSSTTPGPDENAAAAQEQRLPQVDDVLRENPEGVVAVEGTFSMEDGGPARLCRSADFSGPAIACLPEESLTVTGVDLDKVPRLSRVDDVRFAWPPIVLTGEIEDGVLRVTDMPRVFRITLVEPVGGQVFLDQSGRSETIQLTPGQELGLVNQDWADFPDLTVEDGSGSLHLSQPACPSGGSCIAGYVGIDTRELDTGTYRFTQNDTQVTLRVTLDGDPGSTTTPWSVPVEAA